MKAVIFDMNGVIINDERHHQNSWRALIHRHPTLFKTPTEDEFTHEIFGRSERSTLTYLLGRSVTDGELEQFSAERVDVVKSLFNPPILAEGLDNLLGELQAQNIPVGIATGSRPNYTNHILDGTGIHSYIKAVVTADDIVNSKPDPEIYLKTAKALGVSPADCVVFEDTISGIRAARAAGIYVIAIASTHSEDELALADEVIRSFSQVKLEGNQIRIEAQVPSIEAQRPSLQER